MMTLEQWIEDGQKDTAIMYERRPYILKDMYEKVDWFEEKIDYSEGCDDGDAVRNFGRKLRLHLVKIKEVEVYGYELYKEEQNV